MPQELEPSTQPAQQEISTWPQQEASKYRLLLIISGYIMMTSVIALEVKGLEAGWLVEGLGQQYQEYPIELQDLDFRFEWIAPSQPKENSSFEVRSSGAREGTRDIRDRETGSPWKIGHRRDSQDLPGFFSRSGQGVIDIFRMPKYMTSRNWRRFGYAALAIGAVSLVDNDIRQWASNDSSGSKQLADSIEPLGQAEGLSLLAIAWLGGRATGSTGLIAVSEDAFEATLISAGLISSSLKQIIGRRRPNGGDSLSFPSGDVTQAFAIASVVAAHSERRWVEVLSYTTAGLVAWERVRLDKHWASDVVAAALLGTFTGRWVVRRNRGLWQEKHNFELTPLIGQESYGLGARFAF